MDAQPLSSDQRALVDRYLRARSAEAPKAPSIGRRDPGSPVPLSFEQQHVWLHAQLAGEAPIYNESVTVHHRGVLDRAALGRALDEIVRRHEAWRTVFTMVDAEPTDAVGLHLDRAADRQHPRLRSRPPPVPIGVRGELCLGGPGVARGYLNRPKLTAEKFVPDPFSNDPGARLYRTGDLVRWLPDGTLEFLGRLDSQVKIRGHRIEPGEIESVLGGHAEVRGAAVVVHREPCGEARLVAYVVPTERGAARIADLRRHLARTLPSYMIPTLVSVDALPLTPTGKIDRVRLPALDDRDRAVGAAFVPPRGPLKRQLAELWEEVLGVRPVGATDDFFDLGGHSLLAVRLVQRIEEMVGTRLPVATLHTHPTVEELTSVVVGHERASFDAPIVTLQHGGRRWPLFFFHGDVAGGGFYCRRLARRLHPDRPFHAVHPLGLDGHAVPPTIEGMAAAHVDTIRAVQRHGPYLVGGYCNGGLVAWETARLLEAEGERVPLIVLVAAAADTSLRGAEIFLEILGRVLRLPVDRRLEYFARLRFFASRWSALPARSRLPFAIRAARKLVGEVIGVRADEDASWVNVPSGESPVVAGLFEHYWRAAMAYRPRPRHGPVLLFWAIEDTPPGTSDLTMGWSRLAGEVRVHATPGGHDVIVTHHAELIADRLRESLAELGDAEER